MFFTVTKKTQDKKMGCNVYFKKIYIPYFLDYIKI